MTEKLMKSIKEVAIESYAPSYVDCQEKQRIIGLCVATTK